MNKYWTINKAGTEVLKRILLKSKIKLKNYNEFEAT